MQRIRGAVLTVIVVTTGCARLAGDSTVSASSESVSRSIAIERSTWECPASPGSAPQLLGRTSAPYVAMPADAGGAVPPILLGSLSLDLPDACDIAFVSSFPVALYREGQETLVLAADGSSVMTYYGVRYILPPYPQVGSPIVIEEETQGGGTNRLLLGRIGADGTPEGLDTIFTRSSSYLIAAVILPDESALLVLLGGSDWISARSFEFGTGLWTEVAESDVDSGDPLVRQAFIDALAESVPSAADVPFLGWSSGIALGSDGSVAFWNAPEEGGLTWVNDQGQPTVLHDGAIREAFFAPDGSRIYFEARAEGGVVYSADLSTGVVTELGSGSLQSVLPDGSGILVVPFGDRAPALELWRP